METKTLSTTDEVKLAVVRDIDNPESSPDQYQFATPELRELYMEGLLLGREFNQLIQNFTQPLRDAKQQSTPQ